MSFGTSVGDIISLIQLAHRSYRNCKDAGGEYLEIAREVRSLHSVLKSVRDEAEKPGSLLFEKDNVSEFLSISDGCKGVLEDIEHLLAKYNGLADDGTEKKKSKKLWHRMRFGAEIDELGKFRWKIIMYTSQLAVFLDSIHLKSSNRLEKAAERVEDKLESGFTEVMDRLEGFEEMRKAVLFIATKARASERYTSVASMGSVLSLSTYADDDKEVWKQFRSELVTLGFRSDSLERHREVLKAYMMRLDKTGVLDEAVVQGGKSHQPWCMNSFFRLTNTELSQVDENDEFLAGDEDSQSDRTTPSLLEKQEGLRTEPGPETLPTIEADVPKNTEKSSPRYTGLPPSRRKRVTRQKLETAEEQRITSKEDASKRDPIPASTTSSPVIPTAHEARLSTPYQTHGGEKLHPFVGTAYGARENTRYQAYGGEKSDPLVGTPYESRQSTPYQTHGGEKLDPFGSPNLSRSKSQREPSNNYSPRYSQVQLASKRQPQDSRARPKENIARLNFTPDPENPKVSPSAPSKTRPEVLEDVQHRRLGPRRPYAESYHSDTGLASSQSTFKRTITGSRESLPNRPRTEARPSSWHGPDYDSDSDSDVSLTSSEDQETEPVPYERRRQYTESHLKPNAIPPHIRSRGPRRSTDNGSSSSKPSSMKSYNSDDPQGSMRSRSRDRDRSPSPDEGGSSAKYQQAARAALLAGMVEAFRVRNEPGGWGGEKGKRIITAAIGAGGVSPNS